MTISQRYNQQIVLPEWGQTGQDKLRAAHIVCIGVGGLGCPALQYLAAAGIGQLTLVDGDYIELSNLQRQILFHTKDIGKPKASVAKARLEKINPDITIHAIDSYLTAENVLEIAANCHLIIDAADNFAATFLINDLAAKLEIPMIYASANQFQAQLAVFSAKNHSCYRCLYPDYPQHTIGNNCATSGVIGALVGIIGSMQAMEAIKLLLGIDALLDTLYTLEAKQMQSNQLAINKDLNCPICSQEQIILKNYAPPMCDISAVSELPANNLYTLIDIRTTEEWQTGHLPNAIHIPLETLIQKNPLQDKNVAYILYCQTGTRSKSAADILKQQGFTKVKYLSSNLSSLSNLIICND